MDDDVRALRTRATVGSGSEVSRVKAADMVTRTIGLDDVNEAFRAMQAGEVLRGVITHA